MTCEFCEELRDVSRSRFAQIYGPTAGSRIVARRGGLVAMPTIGQLFPGSLLVLPIAHLETMAMLPESEILHLEAFISDLESVVAPGGPILAFEHGARCSTGAGCGIYHAHLHLVPTPAEVSIDDLLPAKVGLSSYRLMPSLIAGLRGLRSSSEYLLVRDTSRRVRVLDSPSSLGLNYPSQYFRRGLAELFHVDSPWDWRMYQAPEQWLLDTCAMFEASDVPIGK